ncbi:rhodanese-like domain-containing protein [bacterium]|nr:rhodanese-like domain-containing protein [bacterium]MCP5462882.1 rhodanese-like domain-containing protein [bacterium]
MSDAGSDALRVFGIGPKALKRKIDLKKNIAIIDVRDPKEREEACISPSILIPLDTLQNALGSLNPCQETIVYCKAGLRGARAARILMENGFTDVKNLDGGISRWMAEIRK